ARPQFRAAGTNGGTQQCEASRGKALRFIDPGDAKSFQRLDRFRGVILHAAEDDEAVAGRFDLVGENLEALAYTQSGKLAFDQPLARLRQRALRLADAHRERAA